MANRLSYSQLNKFKHCPQAWSFHYVQRVRPIAIPSPLIFGSAIGKTFEQMLLAVKNPDIPHNNPVCIFDDLWNQQEINGVLTDLRNNPNIEYLKADHDPELAETPHESLRVKAHLMIRAFREEFLPMITKVHSTEELVELSSGTDTNIGFADAVLSIKGYDKPIVMDFKTAGRAYLENSVRESVQLSQYLYTLGDKYKTDLAGYVVFLKNINKNRSKVCKKCQFDGSGKKFKTCNNEIDNSRCGGEWLETINPKCDIQIIIDQIPLSFQEEIIDDIGIQNDKINSGIIEKNLDGCLNDGYFRKCSYYDICHNGDMSKFVVLDGK